MCIREGPHTANAAINTVKSSLGLEAQTTDSQALTFYIVLCAVASCCGVLHQPDHVRSQNVLYVVGVFFILLMLFLLCKH